MSAARDVSFAQYYYRVNPDNTIDSICGDCFVTAATADNTDDLHAKESVHVCEPGWNFPLAPRSLTPRGFRC